jgi:hypothetical protein
MKTNVKEEKAGTADVELTKQEAESIVGGRVIRITNERVNAQPLAGGSASGASAGSGELSLIHGERESQQCE